MKYLSDDELARLKIDYPEMRDDRCPTCRDTGSYRWQGTDQECDCRLQKRLLVHYLNAGIGLKYQRLGWEDLVFPVPEPVTDYLTNLDSYVRQGLGLHLWGSPGTGKTLLANLVLKELVKREYDCYFSGFSAMVEAFAATWGDKDERVVFNRHYLTSRVLALDDLGKEFRTAKRLPQTTFDYVLRTRAENNRPTIFTTNHNPMEVQLSYGRGVLSLLVEHSIEVPMVAADYRPEAHEHKRALGKAGEVRPIT